MSHSTGHHHHSHDIDWAAMAAHLELQGDVLLPLVTETAASAADLCRRDGIAVRRILDIGSGPGVATLELARHFGSAQVVAADGSPALLERAAARAAGAGLSGRVTTRQVELPDEIERLGQADLIWMAMVLHHIGDEAAMLRRLRRIDRQVCERARLHRLEQEIRAVLAQVDVAVGKVVSAGMRRDLRGRQRESLRRRSAHTAILVASS